MLRVYPNATGLPESYGPRFFLKGDETFAYVVYPNATHLYKNTFFVKEMVAYIVYPNATYLHKNAFFCKENGCIYCLPECNVFT